MKKLMIFILCAALLLSLCATAFADSEIPVYLVSPVSTAVWQSASGAKLLVADNITGQSSVINVFDCATAKWESKTEVAGNVEKISVYGDVLYVVQNGSYRAADLSASTITLGDAVEAENVVDVVNFENVVYLLTATQFKRVGSTLPQISSLVDASSAVVNGGMVYVSDKNNVTVFNADGNLPCAVGKYLQVISCGTTAALCNESGIYAVSINTVAQTAATTPLYIYADGDSVLKACGDSDGNLYLLGSDHKISKVAKNDKNVYAKVENWNIGSDAYGGDIPATSSFTSFTLCKAVTYPATIVYKTSDAATSIEQITTLGADDTFLVLSGAEDDADFYYVLTNGKFGWIFKSAATVSADASLTVINTSKPNNDVIVKAKILNHNTYAYTLPLGDEQYLRQNSLAKDAVVTWLQTIQMNGSDWFYVSFADNTCGFLRDGALTKPTLTATETTVLERKKINSSLSGKFYAYLDETLATKLVDDNDQPLVLQTSSIVKVLKKYDNCVLVQLEDNVTCCFVENGALIDENALTTNTVLGLVLVLVGVAIAVTVIIIVKDKQKKKTR